MDIDISNIPDLAPIITSLASTAKGRTKLYNATREREDYWANQPT